jgi:hypothetical protein
MDNKLCKCGHSEYQHMIAGDFECCYCFCKKFQPCVEPEPQKIYGSKRQNNEDNRGYVPEPASPIKDRISPLASTGYKLKFQKCKYCGGLAGCIKRGWECIPDKPPEPQGIVLTEPKRERFFTDLYFDAWQNAWIQYQEQANTQLQVILARAKREQAREILNEILAIKKSATCDQTDKQGFWDNFWYEFEALKSKYIPEEK